MAIERSKDYIDRTIKGLPLDSLERLFLEQISQEISDFIVGKHSEETKKNAPNLSHKRSRTTKVAYNTKATKAADVFNTENQLLLDSLYNGSYTKFHERIRNPYGYHKLIVDLYIPDKRDRAHSLDVGVLRFHIADVANTLNEGNAEFVEIIRGALNTLYPEDYQLISLRYCFDLPDGSIRSMQEIGEMFNPPLNQSTVAQRLYRVLEQLRHPARSLPISRYIDAQPYTDSNFYALSDTKTLSN